MQNSECECRERPCNSSSVLTVNQWRKLCLPCGHWKPQPAIRLTVESVRRLSTSRTNLRDWISRRNSLPPESSMNALCLSGVVFHLAAAQAQQPFMQFGYYSIENR